MRSRASLLALILVGALAAGACGSGGKSKTARRTSTPSPQLTPSAPLPPSTSSTATGPTSTTGVSGLPTGRLPPATPLKSTTYRNTYVKSAVAAGVPTSLAPQIVDCVIAKAGAQGMRTVGDIQLHQAQFVSDVKQCTQRAAGT